MGHAVLFAAIIFVFLLLTQGVALAVLSRAPGASHDTQQLLPKLMNPKLQLGTMAATYLLSLLTAWLVFPRMWHRGFALGLQWNAVAAKRYAVRIIPAGIVVSLGVQMLQTLITPPKDVPLDDFFRTPADVWLITLFGTLLAPLTEEIFFRGFLLPAGAIAFDWITLKRDPAAYRAWASTDSLTLQALLFSGFVSSGLFALIHAAQLGYSWRSVGVLMGVSFVLTGVRIATKSVAASTLFHASYNFTIFFNLFLQTGGYRHLDKLSK
jgi:membrane protease YdiL (CAAX protease family)